MKVLRDSCLLVFFFNDTATTEIYTLSLHDALPILIGLSWWNLQRRGLLLAHLALVAALTGRSERAKTLIAEDRKSTRLNSSHANISYAVFCLKKKKTKTNTRQSCTDAQPPQSAMFI